MAKKIQMKKLDIVKWVMLFPITLLILFLYVTLVVDLVYKFFDIFLNEEVVAHLVSIFNYIAIPTIVSACGYYISPKFKFKSTLILVLVFLTFETIAVGLRLKEHFPINSYVILSPIVSLISLYFVYKSNK